MTTKPEQSPVMPPSIAWNRRKDVSFGARRRRGPASHDGSELDFDSGEELGAR